MNSLLRRRVMMADSKTKQQGTLETYPSGYVETDYNGKLGALDRAYTPHTSTNYFALTSDSNNVGDIWIYFTFDTSSIPSNATIKSAQCIAALNIYTTNTYTAQMYVGTTAIGEAQSGIGYMTFNFSSCTL